MRITEVTDLARAAHEPSFAGRDDAFALLFSGPADVVLDSGIHELHNPARGAFSVFISPVQARDGVEHARAARRLKGRAGVRLHLREVRATPLGSGYRLKIIVNDRHGKRTSSTRRVTVT